MRLRRLWLTDFRNHEHDELELPPGLTAVTGANGAGKTALLEAIGFLSTLSSFRGATGDVLVRSGASSAVVRGEVERDGRELLIECEISGGRTVAQLNRQRGARRRDLLDALRVSVFTPDDLVLVKGGPGERRRFLDDAMVQLRPRDDALRLELERVLRQRNTLLKQAAGRLSDEIGLTLDVWDQKLVDVGVQIEARRAEISGALVPLVTEAYSRLAGAPSPSRSPTVRPGPARRAWPRPWAGPALKT